MEILAIIIVLVVAFWWLFGRATTKVDNRGNVVCPSCGARNQFSKIGYMGSRRLQCNGCGKVLRFGR